MSQELGGSQWLTGERFSVLSNHIPLLCLESRFSIWRFMDELAASYPHRRPVKAPMSQQYNFCYYTARRQISCGPADNGADLAHHMLCV